MQTTKKLLSLFLVISLLFSLGIQAWAETLWLPSDLESIEEEAFAGDKSLDKVALPDGLRSIGKRAFADSSVKEINFPDSLTSIAEDAFSKSNPMVTAQTENDAFQWAANHGMKTALIPALKPEYSFLMCLPVTENHGLNVIVSNKTRTIRLGNWDLMKSLYGEDYDWSFTAADGADIDLAWSTNGNSFAFELCSLSEIPADSELAVKAVLRWGAASAETVFRFRIIEMPLPENVSFDQKVRMRAGEVYRATVSTEPASWGIDNFDNYFLFYDVSGGDSVEKWHNFDTERDAFYFKAQQPGVFQARPRINFGDNACILGDWFTVSVLSESGWQVTEKALTERAQKHLASKPEYAALTARRLSVEGVTLYEIYKNDGQKKPLLITLHGGGGGNKETAFEKTACESALQGFYSVAIDCAGCGDSQLGPIDAVTCWSITISQIDTLIEYYSAVPQADEKHFGLYGGSMGGNIAFAYVVHGSYRPTIIVPSRATPDLTTLAYGPMFDAFDHGRQCGMVLSQEEIRSRVAALSPIRNPEMFLDVYIYSGNGTADDVTGPEGSRALQQYLDTAGGTKHVFKYYEGCGHMDPYPGYDPDGALGQILLGKNTGPF